MTLQETFKTAMKDHGWHLLLPAVLVVWYEILFSLFTGCTLLERGSLYLLLFSLAAGGSLYLLGTAASKRKINLILTGCAWVVLAVPYLVEYFIYRQFKVFYDVNTVIGGAEGVATGFAGDALRLIFSWNGLLTIILYLLPAAALLVLGFTKKPLPAFTEKLMPQSCKVLRLLAALLTVTAFLVGWALVSVDHLYSLKYDAEYDFQSAVEHFGLLTALRLDTGRLLSGAENQLQMQVPEVPQEPEQPEEPDVSQQASVSGGEEDPQRPQQPVIYGKNVLDIDFAALAEQSSGTVQTLHRYVASLTPSRKNEYTGLFAGKNLIFISAEAFAEQVIDPQLTPTLYRMATKGFQFTDYHQPAGAGTTGGEYLNVFGMIPTAGGKSFKNTANRTNYYTMGWQLNRLGYYGQAFHNNSHTFYDRHLTHNNLGYSQGFMGYGNGMEQYVQSQWPQSDAEMILGTLPLYIDKQPFNIYYMSVSGHSGYSRDTNAMSKKHWDKVAHLDCSDTLKAYYACNLDLEEAMAGLLAALEDAGIADDTVVVIAADHFPYGLDSDAALGNMPYLSELYGQEVTSALQRDHNRLILWSGCLEDSDPVEVSAPTSSLDILPTLMNLFSIEFDSRLLPGRDVFSDAEAVVFGMNYDWKTEKGTYLASSGKFIPAVEGEAVSKEYISRMKTVVRNKMEYCKGVLNTDYFGVLFDEN